MLFFFNEHFYELAINYITIKVNLQSEDEIIGHCMLLKWSLGQFCILAILNVEQT